MLLSTCSEWFDKRDQLLRPLNELKPVPRRLTAFVSFLTELLLGLRGRSGEGEVMNSTRFLAELLCECCHDILQIPSLGNASEARIYKPIPRACQSYYLSTVSSSRIPETKKFASIAALRSNPATLQGA
ncbi:hypothetical protein V5799_024042 [Amblyomma americanum]|uniref:Uncharacterized protein n=1 Tax=Amblyomma americanum TaxID=6943 RepID=A0AAQ4EDR0_AMBAM